MTCFLSLRKYSDYLRDSLCSHACWLYDCAQSSSAALAGCWTSHLDSECITGIRCTKGCVWSCGDFPVSVASTKKDLLTAAQRNWNHLTVFCINLPIRSNYSLTGGARTRSGSSTSSQIFSLLTLPVLCLCFGHFCHLRAVLALVLLLLHLTWVIFFASFCSFCFPFWMLYISLGLLCISLWWLFYFCHTGSLHFSCFDWNRV